jgi:hypothetical protein
MAAVSHIIDKIKTSETTYVDLFVDFSGAFDRMSWPRLFSLLRETSNYTSRLQPVSVLFRRSRDLNKNTRMHMQGKRLTMVHKVPYWDPYYGIHIYIIYWAFLIEEKV